MQARYERAFEREMGLTASEFLRCLPEAFAPHALAFGPGGGAATITLPSGAARIEWRAMAPRSIAGLAALPRTHVRFDFGTVHEAERHRVMKHFDLVMLRGGG